MVDQYITIDKIKWWIDKDRDVHPLCPKHHLRLAWIKSYSGQSMSDVTKLRCEECPELYVLPRGKFRQHAYILNKIDAKIFRAAKYINLDDQAIAIAEDKVITKDGKYFVTALLTESKTGIRLVIYAGEKGLKEKTQIFVEPDIKRLSFDQNDIHPTDIFAKLEATFSDGAISTQEKPKI